MVSLVVMQEARDWITLAVAIVALALHRRTK
jgi:hypothetical protein